MASRIKKNEKFLRNMFARGPFERHGYCREPPIIGICEHPDLAGTFGGLGMHCCADAEHQFELFKKIPGFYGFNRVAARRGWDPLIEHFGGPEAPVHVLGWIDEDAIMRLRQIAPEGARFIFELMGAELDDAKSWLSRMRRGEEG